MRILSLNKQEFSKVINENCIYVDKTEHIYNIITTGNAYFLSRPRRFGKSLLINTLKEIFTGNQELFKDTWIYDKIEWVKYPVIKLDFSRIKYKDYGLETALNKALFKIADDYNVQLKEPKPSAGFEELIIKVSEKAGQVVILVDEYDKPISDYIEDIPQAEENRDALKNFYSCLKGLDSHIKFIFITGVSKFSKVSIFSDLNHLTDITISRYASTLLGYTKDELASNFGDYLDSIANELSINREELLSKVQPMYNGYSWDGVNFVYNPFSIQNFLKERQFDHFWFATGTATFLLKALKNTGKLPEQVSPITVMPSFFDKFELTDMDILSLLFQTGYLTIKKIDYDIDEYTLAFPNGEVEFAFLNNLLEVWTGKVQGELGPILLTITRSVRDGEPEKFIQAFKSLFSGIPYDDFIQQHAIEAIFQSNIYIALKILGVRQQVELHTSQGRIDSVIEGENAVFIAEFKMGSADEAMKQIHEKRYYEPFMGGSKKVFLLALGFDEKERGIASWLVEERQ